MANVIEHMVYTKIKERMVVIMCIITGKRKSCGNKYHLPWFERIVDLHTKMIFICSTVRKTVLHCNN